MLVVIGIYVVIGGDISISTPTTTAKIVNANTTAYSNFMLLFLCTVNSSCTTVSFHLEALELMSN